ncbi:hypothetical protein [Moorena sp. SIO4G3]|uniref:hypothetical protein n=1 Tax=Moorena sp. SIO4G3 TaxID=2607821 RepID=UPI00142A1658|nr:hypothetical protein [Moorena sp. SIO4G3]NEO78537.1 hypothetical protein [Moorena sp. SIO4G3]
MLTDLNTDFNVEVSQVVATEAVASNIPTPSDNGGLLIPLIQGGAAVAAVIALTVYSKTIIEAITKLVKEAKED